MMKFARSTPPLAALAAFVLGAALAGCAGNGARGDGNAAAAHPQVLLLGEVHDNVQGHKLRYETLRKQVEAGWRPAIAMEQFDRDSQEMLNKAQKGCLDAQCVIRVVGGPHWDWQLYYPVIQLALTYQLPLVAVNLSRADASRVVRDGVASTFDAATIAAYHLDQPLPADIRKAQRQDIDIGHCHMLPESMMDGMVNAQVARDVWMARLVRAQQPRDVVLIAGNGHVRKDVGVARWINAVEPPLRTRSVAFLEPGDGERDNRYDAVHKVAAQTRGDPCEAMRPKS